MAKLPESREENVDLDTFLIVNNFTLDDAERLEKLRTIIRPCLPKLTDRFYTQLQKNNEMLRIIEGKIDQLKKTHILWLESLFSGNYDDEFVAQQEHIGFVHVHVKVPPLFVASSMSFLRAEIPQLIPDDFPQEIGETRESCIASILRILDLSQFLIDSAYFKQVMQTMGISKTLLNRLMTV